MKILIRLTSFLDSWLLYQFSVSFCRVHFRNYVRLFPLVSSFGGCWIPLRLPRRIMVDCWVFFCSSSCKSNVFHDSCLLTLTYRCCFYSHHVVLACFVSRLLHRCGCLVMPLLRRLLHCCGLWLSHPSSFFLPVDCCIAVHSLHSIFLHWIMISCNKCRSISWWDVREWRLIGWLSHVFSQYVVLKSIQRHEFHAYQRRTRLRLMMLVIEMRATVLISWY